ncbi:hypothetical protein H312_01308, partial [Anncaliia algerae PRA339]
NTTEKKDSKVLFAAEISRILDCNLVFWIYPDLISISEGYMDVLLLIQRLTLQCQVTEI